MFNAITVIGCGLIGSSLLRAIDKNNLANQIKTFDKSKSVSNYLSKNFAFKVCNSISDSVKDSDLVIISTPLSSYKEVLKGIKSNLKKDAILTDTGSVKKPINKEVLDLKIKDINWISSHPIAGTEYSGPENGFSELFKERWCIISFEKNIPQDKIHKLKNFWLKLGCKVKEMTFEDHDYVLSLTSHLPHAIAYSIVRTSVSNEKKFKKDVIQYSAGGLRDFTRIAASDPLMWKDIFIDNSENLLKAIDSYAENLKDLKKAIKNKDTKKLLKIFSSTKDVRKEIIEAGQDTEKPDFGRK